MILSRRSLLKLGAVVAGCGLGAWQVRRPGPAAVAAPAAVESASPARRLLIVNADDFGMADDINRGIVEAHVHGIVTSTSLLTTWPGAEAAARLAAGYPELSVGLHVDLDGIEPIGASRRSLDAVGEEIERQLGIFRRLMGRLPTHIDSHHHVHLRFNVARVFLDISERYGFPLRGFSRVMYIGGFYGQWPTGRSDLARISPAALMALLGDV